MGVDACETSAGAIATVMWPVPPPRSRTRALPPGVALLRKIVAHTPVIHRVVKVHRMLVTDPCLLMLNGPGDLWAVRIYVGLPFVDSVPQRVGVTGVADGCARCDSTSVGGTMNLYHWSEREGSHHVHQRKRGAQDSVPSH